MTKKTRGLVAQARTQAPLEEIADEALMDGYVAGNEACLEVLVHRYERELFSYLRRYLADDQLAEDVFQHTFLQLHLKRHLYTAGRPVRPWLYKIATHQAIDALRRNRRHRRPSLDARLETDGREGTLLEALADNASEPSGAIERKEKRALMRGAVDGLADHLKSVVVLSYYQGMKYKEIAEILRIPVGTVKSRLHAAIGRLADQWKRRGLTRDET